MRKLVLLLTLALASCGHPVAAKFVPDGPVGWRDMCARSDALHSLFCTDHAAATLALTGDALKLLRDVNHAVNDEFEPSTDQVIFGEREFWTLPVDRADCEDYALEKMLRLVKAGVARGALSVMAGVQKNGDAHAVLAVRTNAGIKVLDNMVAEIRDPKTPEFTPTAIQAAGRPNVWEKIDG